MKFRTQFSLPALILLLAILISSCGNRERRKGDFIIPSSNTGSALTIGWYVPVEMLTELVGPEFKPRVVKGEDQGSISIFIVKGGEHLIDGKTMGSLKSAHVVIPVEKPGNIKVKDWPDIGAAMVLPVNIVEQSLVLGDKLVEYGFSTYTGNIELDIKKTEEKYLIEAKVNTVNGQIEIKCMFEENGETREFSSAMFTHKHGTKTFFYGEERMTSISNGKGNLEIGGDNIIKAMNLAGRPYFLKLNLDLSWEFDFVKE